jgi:hypothetical protein
MFRPVSLNKLVSIGKNIYLPNTWCRMRGKPQPQTTLRGCVCLCVVCSCHACAPLFGTGMIVVCMHRCQSLCRMAFTIEVCPCAIWEWAIIAKRTDRVWEVQRAVVTKFVAQFITLAISAMATSAISGFWLNWNIHVWRPPAVENKCDLLAVALFVVRALCVLFACAKNRRRPDAGRRHRFCPPMQRENPLVCKGKFRLLFEQKLIFDNRLHTATWKMWPSAVGCLNIACAHMMARTSLILLVVVPTCVHFWFRFLTRRGIFVVVRFATG